MVDLTKTNFNFLKLTRNQLLQLSYMRSQLMKIDEQNKLAKLLNHQEMKILKEFSHNVVITIKSIRI